MLEHIFKFTEMHYNYNYLIFFIPQNVKVLFYYLNIKKCLQITEH